MTVQRTVGLEEYDGNAVGRDPRTLSVDELQQLGHARMSPLKALRLRCVDCCAGSAREVRLCVSVTCPSWPFRMGSNPWRGPVSEARREQGQRLAASIAATRSKAFSGKEQTATEGEVAPTPPPPGTAVEFPRREKGANR